MGAIVKIVSGVVGLIFVIIILATIAPVQFQQQQATKNLIDQDKNQLNDASVNLINNCETDQSVGDLTMCRSGIVDIKNRCHDPQYSSMSVCSDSRIDQFLSTVDNKIAYAQTQISSSGSKFNDAVLKIIDMCSQMNDPNNISTCETEMMQIQQECNTLGVNAVPACNDPRIVQIMNKQITQSSNVYDYASQTMESFINLCLIAQDENAIQDCSIKAKQMISLCQSTNVHACSDPRLQQIVNMEQSTNSTAPLNNPSQATINATVLNDLNNQIQNILNECASIATSNSPTCINAINTIKQDCNSTLKKTHTSYFPACNDPRLQ